MSSSRWRQASAVLLVPTVALALVGCKGNVAQTSGMPTPVGATTVPADPDALPPELAEGKALYRTYCQSCHGPAAAGSEMGPPLVHEYYGPAAHSDEDVEEVLGVHQVSVETALAAHGVT